MHLLRPAERPARGPRKVGGDTRLGEDAPDDFVGVNLGLGLSSDRDRWVIRPEVGFLKDPGEEGTLWQWSLGFSFLAEPGS
ncbi:MAG: hypothetical protein OXG58_00925 [Gemmatimonadetes bacterium]|nr:hypothetical protein [Gemmatimonadota bacterium]MCY3942467.1 hypothetical protein [Gemmatimonadota bacterium]